MKLTVNLATKPFVELRPLLLRLRWAMGGLAVLAILLAVGLKFAAAKASTNAAAVEAVAKQTRAFNAERAANEKSMQQPTNAALLTQSQFLNGLFTQKAFSWTAVMMDLETVLPGGVQVASIEPQIDKRGVVTLRIRVTGDRDKAIEFVVNLEKSKHFRDARLADEALQTQDAGPRGAIAANNGVDFNVYVVYNPLPLHDAHQETEDAKRDDATIDGKTADKNHGGRQ